MLPRQSSDLWGTESGDAVKIWSLHLASYWLHIPAIIQNTSLIIYFKESFFFSFLSRTTKVKGNVPSAVWNSFTTLALTSFEVFLDGRQSPLATQTCKMFYLLLSQEKSKQACEPDTKMRDGKDAFHRGQGVSHLPLLCCTSDHSKCLLIGDLETSEKLLNEN